MVEDISLFCPSKFMEIVQCHKWKGRGVAGKYGKQQGLTFFYFTGRA